MGQAANLGENAAGVNIAAHSKNPDGGLFLALGVLSVGVGLVTLIQSLKPTSGGTPPGLNCAQTGQSCASVACCLGPSACNAATKTCEQPGPDCAQVGSSCANVSCCAGSNVVCAPGNHTCIQTVNQTCAGCTPPSVCNAGQCVTPYTVCSNCFAPNDYCDTTTGTCIHPCDPPCASASDCDLSTCGNPPTDGCASCTGEQAQWNISSLALALQSNVGGPVVGGDLVDVFISFTYAGPGGNIILGYNAWLNSVLGPVCSVTLTDQTPVWVMTSQGGGYDGYYTSGMTWPQMDCWFCDGCAGVTSDYVYAQPFVITPDGQTWHGATVQGLFCC